MQSVVAVAGHGGRFDGAFQKPTPPAPASDWAARVDDGNRDPGRRLPLHVDESTADDLLGAEANFDLRCEGVRVQRLPSHAKAGGAGDHVEVQETRRRGARQQHPEAARAIGGCLPDDLVGIRVIPARLARRGKPNTATAAPATGFPAGSTTTPATVTVCSGSQRAAPRLRRRPP